MAQPIILSAKYKRNYVAFFAVLLFFLIIAGEIALAISIPVYMSRENAMAAQVRKLHFIDSFDMTRYHCGKISSADPMVLLEKQLLSSALDQMALYLRREIDHLTPPEIEQINQALQPVTSVVHQEKAGKPQTSAHQLRTDRYINTLLKNYAGKHNNARKQ